MFDEELPPQHTKPIAPIETPMDSVPLSDISRARALIKQLREVDEEALKLYEPMYYQEKFHSCRAKEALLLKANQIGGSLAMAVEIGRAVTGQDMYHKYPKRDGICVCVGYGEKHIGTTFYKKLFRPGAFRIIRDLDTKAWRTYRPWPSAKQVDGRFGDMEREKESIPAPPIIPKRFIDGKISWVRKSEDIFSRVKFTSGWELYAANSAGDPEHLQGLAGVWLYVFDEDVAQSGWYEEAVQRTSAVNGYLRWNAMPHSKTNDIMSLVERGEEEEGSDNPQTVVIRVEQRENPYLSDAAKEQNARIAKSMGEDVYRKRILGELTIGESLMYPGFSKVIHGARTELTPEQEALEADGKVLRSPLQVLYARNKFVVPEDWTRRTSTDPGHSVCATLFAATPPPDIGNYVLIYDELYITKNTASLFAELFKKKIGDQVIEEMLFDMHGGHLRGAGDRMWIHEYQDAIEEAKIRCEATGSRFRAACDKISFREEQVRNWLEVRDGCRESGFPTVYIDIVKCPNLVREIQHFKKKTVKQNGIDVVIDEGNRRGATHAVEDLEYLAAHGCRYVKPRPRPKYMTRIDAVLAEKAKRRTRIRMSRLGRGSEDNTTITLGAQGTSK